MRSHLRTIIVLALAAGLVGLFLYKVDLLRVAAEIARARPEWLALSLATMIVNLAIRAFRWQYLLEPLGHTTFARAFRATAVGFAANSVLPARAGEVIRPYFLARTDRAHGRMSATGAFATIILERLLDVITVLVLLASYVFVFGRDLRLTNPIAVTGRDRRVPRGVSLQRDGVLRRARRGGRRRGDRPSSRLDRPVAAPRSDVRGTGRAERDRHAASRRRATPYGMTGRRPRTRK